MKRRLFLLPGIAILTVVCHHAASWGFAAMLLWTDRYRSVSVPNFDQVGSLAFYVLVLVQRLTLYPVPAFLLVSGYFVAFAARGSQSGLPWKTVGKRLIHLLVPYLIWSVVVFVGDAAQGDIYAPSEYLWRLLLGRADNAYFYVPMICQMYLLAPLLVRLARARAKLLLVVAALVQLGAIGLGYLRLLDADLASRPLVRLFASDRLFTEWIFFFSLGIVCCFRAKQFQQWLHRWWWGLLAALVVFGAYAVIEPRVFARAPIDPVELRWLFAPNLFSSNFYSLAAILCFLACDRISIPFARGIQRLGSSSYGIYLVHVQVLELAALITREVIPGFLAYSLPFVLLLLIVGLGVPLLMMAAVSRSPARKAYRFLFG